MYSPKAIIKHLENLPMNDRQILKKINTNILLYNDLKYVNNIDEILKNNSVMILLPNKKSNIGHWVCICLRNGNTLSYFDSYGNIPDSPKYDYTNYIPLYLSQLLLKSPYNLEYNEYNFQNKSASTCGRHCIIRILLNKYSVYDYAYLMELFKASPDTLVTVLSEML